MTFIALAKIIGALKEVLIAKEYGISQQLDAFNFAINASNVVSGMLFSALSLTLGLVLKGPSFEVKAFLKELTYGCILIGALVGIIVLCLVRSDRNVYDGIVAVLLSLILVPTCVAALLSALATLRGQHVSSLLEGVPATVLAVALLIFAQLDIVELATVALIGSVAHCLLLINLNRGLKSESVNLNVRTAHMWSAFGKSIIIVMFAQSAIAVTVFADNYFLLRNGAGQLTEFTYSSKIVSIVLSIFGLTISRFFLPYFLNNNNQSQIKLSIYYSTIILLVTGLFAFIVYYYMEYIVFVLYQNGNFDSEDTVKVAGTARILILQFPFYVSGLIFVAFYSGNGAHALIAATAVVAACTKFMIYTASEWNITPQLVASSTAWMYVASYSVYLIYAIRTYYKKQFIPK
jgi:putative peptidoglycan lipid II flippase